MNTSDDTTKRCPKCIKEYPLTAEFWHRNKSRKDGYSAYCKTCSAEISRNYSISHRDQHAMRVRIWRANNPEKTREIDARSRNKKDPEKKRASVRAWYQKYPDRAKENVRKFHEHNPGKVREYSVNRRSRQNKAEGKHTARQIRELLLKQDQACFHCETDLSIVGYHVDHWIPLSRGGSNWIENIRLLCPKCNSEKHDKLPCEWDSRYCE